MACSALEKGIYVKWILGFYSLICSPMTIYSSMLNKKNLRCLVSAQVEAGCVFEKVCVCVGLLNMQVSGPFGSSDVCELD